MRPHEVLETRWAVENGLEPNNMVACSSGTAALCLATDVLVRSRTLTRGTTASRCYYPDICMHAAVVSCRLASLGLVPGKIPGLPRRLRQVFRGPIERLQKLASADERPDRGPVPIRSHDDP